MLGTIAATAAVALSVSAAAGHAALSATTPASPARTLTEHFASRALHERREYIVYLPPGYTEGARLGVRYPVLYFLHSAVASPAIAYTGARPQVFFAREYAAHRVHPMILVMVDGRDYGVTSDSEFANIGLGRYEDAVVETIHDVDRRFSTIRDRRARLIAGVSTGGYGAANVTLHHLPLVGAFESWAGYFMQTREYPFTHEPESVLLANSPYAYVSSLRARLHRYPTWGFAYQGRQDATDSFMVRFIRRFDAAGGHGTVRYMSGGHGWRTWWRIEPEMIRWASTHLLAPR